MNFSSLRWEFRSPPSGAICKLVCRPDGAVKVLDPVSYKHAAPNGAAQPPIAHPRPDLTATIVLAIFVCLLFAACAGPKESSSTTASATPQRSAAVAGSANLPTAKPVPPDPKEWRPLFDGQTLKGWAITDFGGHGEVK